MGLGSSPGFHPYLHARSEATASVDMLRAGRNYCASNNIGLNGQVFLAGYSQGGHTEMADALLAGVKAITIAGINEGGTRLNYDGPDLYWHHKDDVVAK